MKTSPLLFVLGSVATVTNAVAQPQITAANNPMEVNVADYLEGLNYPNGVAFRDGDLYVAEIDRVLKYEDIDGKLPDMPAPVVVVDDLPDQYQHGWKFIAIGPDDKLYIPIGAPCNACELEDRFGSMLRVNLDGSDLELVATGVRNTVGFDWHPESGELWFADNGRDLWGDDTPPEELNNVTRVGQHFGFPYRYGKAIVDDEFEDFASGWMEENKYWGRPVDVEEMADGPILVSDDHNGVIYRISYTAP